MNRKKVLWSFWISALMVIFALGFIDTVRSGAENPNGSKVVFFVS